MKALLHEQLHFTFITNTTIDFVGREPFLTGETWPKGVGVTLVDEAYQGETAFQMYDARNGEATLRVVERLVIRDGLIVAIDFMTDQAAYDRFKAA
jgi:hypothetical protein